MLLSNGGIFFPNNDELKIKLIPLIKLIDIVARPPIVSGF